MTYNSAEIYDPSTGLWSQTAPLSIPRHDHSATLLADGRVLVVGGCDATSGECHASAEIYDPASRTWQSTGSLATRRNGHSATLLRDGRVLVVDGYWNSWLADVEIYHPATGTWSQATRAPSCHGVAHSATLLPDSRVLVVGGACGSGPAGITDAADIFSPVDGTWMPAARLPTTRENHTATLLRDGTVLVVGGDSGAPPRYRSSLIYDSWTNSWSSTGSLATGRRNHTATLLGTGRVLVVGGWSDATTFLDSAELY